MHVIIIANGLSTYWNKVAVTTDNCHCSLSVSDQRKIKPPLNRFKSVWVASACNCFTRFLCP